MKLGRIVYGLAVAAVCGFSAASAQAIVSFDWATVDQDLGNAADIHGAGFGSVDYAYRISKHEVTNAQYAEFLNAVDPTGSNALGLYNGLMSSEARGGINFNAGAADGSKYEVKSGRGANPVVFVNFYDTLRFSNWLHNGQGAGDTETGAYTLLGGTAVPSNALTIARDPMADIFLTSEDEWYKAAYYDPTTDSYFDYATSSDTMPTVEAPAGGTNSANYGFIVGNTTAVGAYTGSVSPFGTFDQSGNVWEWNESLISGSFRGLRGGSWVAANLPATDRFSNVPANERFDFGFRVASRVATDPPSGAVPEPATMFLSALASAAVLGACGRRRA